MHILPFNSVYFVKYSLQVSYSQGPARLLEKVRYHKKLAWIYRNDLVVICTLFQICNFPEVSHILLRSANARFGNLYVKSASFSCERSTKNGCQLDETCKVACRLVLKEKVLYQVILQWSKNSRATLTFFTHKPQMALM